MAGPVVQNLKGWTMVMTSPSHGEDPQFNSAQAHFYFVITIKIH